MQQFSYCVDNWNVWAGDGHFKKQGAPSSQDKNCQQSCANLSISSEAETEAVFLLSTDHKSIYPFGLAHSFCRHTNLWIVLPGPLHSTFQALLASICHADCPWSCRVCLEARWAHFSPTPTRPGWKDMGQQHLSQQSHQVTGCWAPTAAHGKG